MKIIYLTDNLIMLEKTNLNKDNFNNDETVEFTDQFIGLFPKPEFPDFQVDLSQFKLKEFDIPLIRLKPLDIWNLHKTAIQEFKNPSEDNAQKLQLIPYELWLNFFLYLDAKSLVSVMISCKFFGEITNNQEIRNKLGKSRWCNRQPLNLFFSEVDSGSKIISRTTNELLNKLSPNPICRIDEFLKQDEKELYQPGDKGFVMKK